MAEEMLQGSRKGGSKSPIIFTHSNDVILDVMGDKVHPIDVDNPSQLKGTQPTCHIDQFIDDQSN